MSASASSVGGKETQLQTEEAWSPQICTNTHTKHQCKGSCQDRDMWRAEGHFSRQNSQIQRDKSTTNVVGLSGTCPQFERRSHFQSLSFPFFFDNKFWKASLCTVGTTCRFVNDYCLCVCMHRLSQGRHGISAGINLLSLNAPNYFFLAVHFNP